MEVTKKKLLDERKARAAERANAIEARIDELAKQRTAIAASPVAMTAVAKTPDYFIADVEGNEDDGIIIVNQEGLVSDEDFARRLEQEEQDSEYAQTLDNTSSVVPPPQDSYMDNLLEGVGGTEEEEVDVALALSQVEAFELAESEAKKNTATPATAPTAVDTKSAQELPKNGEQNTSPSVAAPTSGKATQKDTINYTFLMSFLTKPVVKLLAVVVLLSTLLLLGVLSGVVGHVPALLAAGSALAVVGIFSVFFDKRRVPMTPQEEPVLENRDGLSV